MARLLDWVVLAAVGLVVGVFMGIAAGIIQSLTGRPADLMIESMQQTSFIGWIGSTIATLAYHICAEGLSGSTPGKRLLRLQVIGGNGRPIQFVQGLKRSVAFLVDALFFGAIAAHVMSESPEKKRIGDNWAETRVVWRRSLPPEVITPASRLLLAFSAAIVVAAMLTLVTQLLEYLWFRAA